MPSPMEVFCFFSFSHWSECCQARPLKLLLGFLIWIQIRTALYRAGIPNVVISYWCPQFIYNNLKASPCCVKSVAPSAYHPHFFEEIRKERCLNMANTIGYTDQIYSTLAAGTDWSTRPLGRVLMDWGAVPSNSAIPAQREGPVTQWGMGLPCLALPFQGVSHQPHPAQLPFCWEGELQRARPFSKAISPPSWLYTTQFVAVPFEGRP